MTKQWTRRSEAVDRDKERRLRAAGWRLGDAADFLELTPEEVAFIEVKVALARHLRRLRAEQSWTQSDVAERLGSSQSRVAKMEAADPSVSIDLLLRALLTLGASREEVGRIISQAA